MRERDLEKKLVKEINKLGGRAIKLDARYNAGIPDRLCVLREGIAFFVEMKAPGKKPTKIQESYHNYLRRLPFPVYVIDSKKGIQELIEKYKI